jgi:hypothetical protein
MENPQNNCPENPFALLFSLGVSCPGTISSPLKISAADGLLSIIEPLVYRVTSVMNLFPLCFRDFPDDDRSLNTSTCKFYPADCVGPVRRGSGTG